ncbi:YdcF family protein [Leptotrichia sp. OH3620_COT-345]|uniref:YdcF family protein n=1 Tax=Leptotrichia sp. OH3620_COT-345 TaxID=2491048 RepID=UPI000F648B11|nr:YdcF family protein [Leptotrichia sp. OH3620_COT-345]RRD40905.1 YdcF family protein [Leptotrichia sp. OH3620_COT-345]
MLSKSKKILKIMFILFLILFVFIQFLIISGMKDESNEKVDYVVILGGRVYGNVPSASLKERIKTAAEYLKKHPEVKAVASGGKGKGEDISEAEVIKKELIKRGINENSILSEDKSRTTVENLKFSIKKINSTENKNGNFKILIVTNEYHLYRAKKIAEKLGIKAYGLSAKTPLISVPKSHIREFAAIIKYYFKKNNIK